MNAENSLLSLSPDQVKELWSKTYNREGKPDWSHIFPYYSEEIVFRDSIQEVRGLAPFKELCNRLTKRCQQLEMDIISIVKNDKIIFMQWEMTMVFKRTPKSTVYGATKLTLSDAGRIVSQRDYYDLWGDIYDNIPLVSKLYRFFMKKVFG